MRRPRLALLLLASSAALLCAAPARALDPQRAVHQYVSRTWGVAEGLPQNSVNATVQTPDGYLWVATEEGIVRFDGARFTVFSEATTDALTHNDVTDLCVDGGGALWVAVRGGGVLRYEHGAFRVWHQADGLVDEFATKVACGPADDVWAGTARGVTHFHAGKLTSYEEKDGLPSDNVTALLVDDHDTAYVGTDAGLARFSDGVHAVTFTRQTGLPFDTVTAMLRRKDGSILVGGRGGVARLDPDGTLSTFDAPAAVVPHEITSMVDDSDGNLWIGTREGGIHRKSQDGAWTTFRAGQGLADDVVQSVFEDREKSLWIGTETRGVQRLANSKVVTYDRFDGITGALMWSIFEDRDGNVWVGSRGAGVHRRAPDGTVRSFSTRDGLPADTVYGIAQAPDGAMWFATQGGGAARLGDDGKFTVYDTKHGLAGDWARSVCPDSHGNVWIGMEGGGLDRLRGGALEHYSTDEGVLSSNSVRMIVEDRNGTVWFGTDGGGVTSFKDEKFTTIRKADGLSDDSVISYNLDDDGSTWFGTYHGITRMQNGKLARATTKDGLFTNIAFTVLNGPDETLFMASNMGITEIKKRDFDLLAKGLESSIKGKLYGVSDGMKVAECNGGSPAGVRGHDGKLWFATMGGAVMIDPAAIHPNPLPPPVVIETVQVNRMDVKVADTIVVEPGGRDFELRYTAMSFLEPERVRFRYKLTGFDQDWVEAGPRRAAFYTNLPPGTYTFQVIAANADGLWNDKGAAVTVRLLPHFYETWPFYVVVGAGVLLLAGAIFRARVAQLRAYSRELERRVAARTAELGEALGELRAKDARISEDLEQARAFQQGILPKLPARSDIRFGVCYTPADQVGGDVYDVCEIENGTIRVFIADTTGHGVQASLRTMVLRTEYDAVKLSATSPAQALEAVNRRLFARHKDLELRCNAICFDVRVENGGARVAYANCAQPPLLHAGAGGVEEVYEKGPFLAMTDEIQLQQREIDMKRGDRLLVFTDGVFEQEDPKGTQFGFEPLTELLADRAREPQALVDELCARVRAFAGTGKPLDDDVTIICVAV